jgi:hypothetical protein
LHKLPPLRTGVMRCRAELLHVPSALARPVLACHAEFRLRDVYTARLNKPRPSEVLDNERMRLDTPSNICESEIDFVSDSLEDAIENGLALKCVGAGRHDAQHDRDFHIFKVERLLRQLRYIGCGRRDDPKCQN